MRRMLAVLLVVVGWAGAAEAQSVSAGLTVVTRSMANGSVKAQALCFGNTIDQNGVVQQTDPRGYTCPVIGEPLYQWYLSTCTKDSCATALLKVKPTASVVTVRGLKTGRLYRITVVVPWSVQAGVALFSR
jgi:hypothetical protein